MPAGSDLRDDVANLVARYDDSVTADQNIVMEMASLVQREIVAEILTVDDDWLTKSATFATVADRSPNRYSFPSDFANFRYLERVVSDPDGDYERIWPIHHIGDKEITVLDEFRGLLTSSSGATGRPVGYLLGDDFIELHPISDAAYTLRIWYQKSLSDITTGGTIELPYVLYQALVYRTAAEYQLRLNAPNDDLMARYERSLARGLFAIQQRYDDTPRTVSYIGSTPGEYI